VSTTAVDLENQATKAPSTSVEDSHAIVAGDGTSSGTVRTKSKAPALIGGRYRVIRRLGRGGMGAVYLVTDRHRGDRQLALKQIRRDRVDVRMLRTIQNEFLTLARFAHPNIMRVYDFGVDRPSGDIYFTSEVINGSDWQRLVSSIDLSTDEGQAVLLVTLIDVLRGLEFIHCHGLVHLDIKPENVLIHVPEGEGEGLRQAKLIDFGLVRREKEFGGKKIMGTTYYIAPETILGAKVDRRTDLYSLGAVLYHLVSERVPFHGRSNIDIFKGHLERAPIPPHEINPTVPIQLSNLILRLLEKKPTERYQSAAEVIDEVIRDFGVEGPLESSETISAYLHSVGTAGWESDFDRLNDIVSQATRTTRDAIEWSLRTVLEDDDVTAEEVERGEARVPEGRVVLVRSESVVGRRRLLENLRSFAQVQGVRVLEVECGAPAREARIALVRELAGYASGREDDAGGELAAAVVDWAKEIQKAPDGVRSKTILELSGRAGRTIVDASREEPCLLLLHDFHLADASIAEFVRCVVEHSLAEAGSAQRMVIIGALTSEGDDAAASSPLGSIFKDRIVRAAVHDIELERLEDDGVRRLVRKAFRDLDIPDDFVRKLLEASDGNCDVVVDTLKQCIGEGVIVHSPNGWILRGDYVERAVLGRSGGELHDRIESLEAPECRFIDICSVLGSEGDFETARLVAGLGVREAEEALRSLVGKRLVRQRDERDEGRTVEFVSKAARESIYTRIPEGTRKGHHARVARILEERSAVKAVPPRELAWHFLRGGDRAKGFEHGISAAEDFVRRFEIGRAIEMYEDVLGAFPLRSEEEVNAIRRRVAALYFEIGEYTLVVNSLESILADTALRANIAGYAPLAMVLARSHSRLGNYRRAADLTRELSSLLRQSPSEELVLELSLACAEVHASKGNHLESLRCCERLQSKDSAALSDSRRGRMLEIMAECREQLDDLSSAADLCQSALKIADRVEGSARPDNAVFLMGRYFHYKGKIKNAIRQFEVAARLGKKMGNHERRAAALFELGKVQLEIERPRRALPCLETAHRVFRQSGNIARNTEASIALGEVYRLLGEYEDARRCFETGRRNAVTLKNRSLFARSELGLAGMYLDSGDNVAFEASLTSAESSVGILGAALETARRRLRVKSSLERGNISAALAECEGADGDQADPGRVAAAGFLWGKAEVLLVCDQRVDVRRIAVSLQEIARKTDFSLAGAKGKWIEAVILSREGRSDLAEKAFLAAEDAFSAEGWERGLVALRYELGVHCMRKGDFEGAYLNFEDGFYIAKRLGLSYEKSRFYCMMGVLEAVIPEGQIQRAEERLRLSLQIAERSGYVGLQWRAHHFLSRITERMDEELAREHESTADSLRRRVISSVPLRLRSGFERVCRLEELADVLGERIVAAG
jgi:serine/threonine protein kinase/tetratricopeptide (TPR) repeat protein